MALKNKSLTISIWLLDNNNNVGLSGMANNLSLRLVGDGTEYSLSTSAVEVNPNTIPGLYNVTLVTSATNFDCVTVGGTSTSGVVVPFTFTTERGYFDNIVNTLDTISADTNQLTTATISANVVRVNDSNVVISDFRNTQQQIYDMSVSAIEDNFSFSGINVNANVAGGSVSAEIDSDSIATSLLAATIDTKTFQEIMEMMLALTSGKIVRTGNRFQYMKQDGSTVLFTLESSSIERNRL